MRQYVPILLLLLVSSISAVAQTSTDTSFANISDKALHSINDKYIKLTDVIDRQSLKLVTRMQRKEARLQNKVQGADSTKAKQLFTGTQAKYQQLQTQLASPVTNTSGKLKEYVPGIDSLATSLDFLQKSNLLPADKLARLQNISSQLQQLQARLQQANEVQAFIKERERQLKQQLSQYNMGGQLLGINKQVYYYQQQLAQYKDLINNKEKLEEFILAKVRSMPAFESFWQHNSLIAQLFPMPQNYGTPAALAGLQTRTQVANIISQRLPGAFTPSGSGSNYLQQQLQTAQTQINTIKDKISQLGGGSSDMTMPDFVPNSQHNKSFFRRLEYGFNFQTSQATNLLPAISDMGLTLGYKLSDKAVMGIGASYKLGLGRGFNHISFTNQGVGLRSYMDIKAKGSIWLTGGYEYNFMQQFAGLRELRNDVNVWQKSALIGITKKYSIGKNKQGNIQLLYDYLYKYEVPRGTALKFRIGYTF
ncbi:MAG TPA: hypothetical protein VG738_19105 [Chitinophagaceae bacterium]|nr:hypothetical protein [Chitinophagaceae bacterium]